MAILWISAERLDGVLKDMLSMLWTLSRAECGKQGQGVEQANHCDRTGHQMSKPESKSTTDEPWQKTPRRKMNEVDLTGTTICGEDLKSIQTPIKVT